MGIVTSVTSTALWHDIVLEAEQSCSVALKEDLESYLVFLLMRYVNKPEMIKHIIALKFLQGNELTAARREVALRDVGDNCLLFAGLFPRIAESRLVRLSYFVKIGQAAYVGISKKSNDLYDHLSSQFVPLMDVLQAIPQHSKKHPDLLPLEAYELWNDTGSRRALAILRQYTHSETIPTLVEVKDSFFK
ncbi:MAG TPA: hypothetical protein VLI69_06305 [Gammaproteobacteria bacterium]|nr:hypothetical protein [Gammaproteobacteria bacterium]